MKIIHSNGGGSVVGWSVEPIGDVGWFREIVFFNTQITKFNHISGKIKLSV